MNKYCKKLYKMFKKQNDMGKRKMIMEIEKEIANLHDLVLTMQGDL